MTLEDLGYNRYLETFGQEDSLSSSNIGRVISEYKERYRVQTERHEFEAEVIGNLRFTAKDRSEFPAVGDWVTISEYDENKVLIHKILPRNSIIERTAVGQFGETQIIATNIDYALIIQAVDRDFNINRSERYLTICYNSGVKPILVLNKIDLITDDELKRLLETVGKRIQGVPVIASSNKTKVGYADLLRYIFKGYTYCLLGSSGVGKSTLINNISGKSLMQTNAISKSTNKGRHVTSHRELFILDNGGILLDNPGMREVGIAGAAEGLDIVFENMASLSHNCKFKNCTHTHETGCAIIEAVKNGSIEKASYENYMKMVKERKHFETSFADKKKKEKNFGKIVKNYKKFRRLNE